MKMPNIDTNICTICDSNEIGDLTHSLMICPYNGGAGQFLLEKLHCLISSALPQQVVLLDLDVELDLDIFLDLDVEIDLYVDLEPDLHVQTRT